MTYKPKEIFQLAVRLLGLVFLYHGLINLPMALVRFFNGFFHFHFETMFNSFLMSGWSLILAWWLMRGARFLVNLVYPKTSDPMKTGPEIVKSEEDTP